MSNDNEDEFEEELVCVDLSGLIDCNWSHFVGTKCKFISLDSEKPVLQMGKHIFQGEYKNSLGTRLFFDAKPDDYENLNDKTFKTFKLLDVHKIFIQEKSELNKDDAVEAMGDGNEGNVKETENQHENVSS